MACLKPRASLAPAWGLLKMHVFRLSIKIAIALTGGLVGKILNRDPSVTGSQHFTALKSKQTKKVVFKVYKFSQNESFEKV